MVTVIDISEPKGKRRLVVLTVPRTVPAAPEVAELMVPEVILKVIGVS